MAGERSVLDKLSAAHNVLRQKAGYFFAPGVDEVGVTCVTPAKQGAIRWRKGGPGVSDSLDFCKNDHTGSDIWEPLTGASMSDADFTLYDDGDPTKQMQFEASGITTATKRTLTVPDANGTIALREDTGGRYLAASLVTTWDPPGVSDHNAIGQTFTVTGAVVGDAMIDLYHTQKGMNNFMIWTAAVTATDTVLVRLTNTNNTGTINVASGDLTILIWRWY